MNKKILILFLLLLNFYAGNTIAQTSKIKAYLGEKQYYDPTLGNYIEFQFQFVGYTFKYELVEEGLQGKVKIGIVINQENKKVFEDTYALNTPIMRDSIIDDFFEIKRVALQPGNYQLSLVIEDLLDSTKMVKATKKITIRDFSTEIQLSDIQINENVLKGGSPEDVFFKSGLLMFPKITTFFSEEEKQLPVYFEIYNTMQAKDSAFILLQEIIDREKEVSLMSYRAMSRVKQYEVIPILKLVDISNLLTGNYELRYSLLTRNNDTLTSSSYFFDRSNDQGQLINENTVLIDPAFQSSIHNDSVAFYLASLIPVAKQSEVKNIIKILKEGNDSISRKHIQAFWLGTAGVDYYEQWLKYKTQVLYVEKLYRNNYLKGYETDRGRVYLQYGAPSMVVQRDVSSTEYPYEIWQYNKIGRFSNKRFIFYNPDLITNGYRLLHSDMVGELKNNSWQYELNKRNTNTGTVDDPNQNVQPSYGGNANDYFRQY